MVDKVTQAVMRTIIEEVGNEIKDTIVMELFEKKLLRDPAAAHYMNEVTVVLNEGQRSQYVKLEERNRG